MMPGKIKLLLIVSIFSTLLTYGNNDTTGVYLSLSIGRNALHGEQFGQFFHAPMRSYVYNNKEGPYIVGVSFPFKKIFQAGVVASYERFSGNWFKLIDGQVPWSKSSTQKYDVGQAKGQIFTIAADAALEYTEYMNGYLRIYGLLGMGIAYRKEVDAYEERYYYSTFINGVSRLGDQIAFDNNRLKFKFQLTPIGISLGRRLRVFTEFGIGYKGLINVGLMGRIA